MAALPELEESKALYVRVADALAEFIRDAGLKPGDKLPSQNEIMSHYRVSQSTVRQALLNLSNQGLVVAYHGKGLFVAEPRVVVSLQQLALVSKTGMTDQVKFELIKSQLVSATSRIATLLKIPISTNVVRYYRRIFVNKKIIGMETANIPMDILNAFKKDQLKTVDLVKALNASHCWKITHTNMTISAGCIAPFDAELLGVAADTSILQREEVVITEKERPLLMTRTVLLADQVSIFAQVNVGRTRQ